MQSSELADTLTPSPNSVSAIYLKQDDLKVAASILYNAYFDDPLFMSIFQADKEGYENRLRSAIREELNAFWVAKQPMVGLFDEDRLLAVACLTAPDTAFSAGRYWHWRLKMLLTAGLFGTRQMMEKEERVRALVPAKNYFMVSFIAVHPDYQHKGLGHILLGAIDSIVEDESQSEGVAVLATVDKHKSFFDDAVYKEVGEISEGHIHGTVMFKARQKSI